MDGYATPNLPARSFDATEAFYGRLGFTRHWRDDGWLILKRGGLMLEFFPHPEVDPLSSWFSCCLRLTDLDAFYADCRAADIAEGRSGFPRLHPPVAQPWGRMAALIDLDGTLLRLIETPAPSSPQ
ncbi:bleomycin resistance protein [Caenispirillum bisanense]|uniref:bleomycin resistance protein n=1 Tax=Caenispirillum bisanense TaxID=414052 RepID=UPI0031D67C6B